MAKITFQDKVALNPQPSIAEINKCTDANINEIKTCVNDNCTYSTNEVCIGEWLGKPLYRTVYSGTTGNTETSFSLSYLNISQLVNTYGTVGSSGDFKPIPFILESGGAMYYISARYALGAMYISNSSAYGSKPFYLILEYTKTTD